jgi:hypothetical protein
MVGIEKIISLTVMLSLILSAGIFDDLIESLNIDKTKKEVMVENSAIGSITNEKEDANKEKKDKIILLGETISVTNSDIKVDNKNIEKKSNLGKVVIIAKDITMENSEVKANVNHRSDNKIIGHNGSVYIKGEKIEVENSSIRASSTMGSGNVVSGNSGSVVLGSH